MNLPSGAALQGSLTPQSAYRSDGRLLRGVVVSTLFSDDAQNPYNTPQTTAYGVFCDVLCYGGRDFGTPLLVRRALVSQERASIQGGDIWVPRAAALDVTGQPFSLPHCNIMHLDGDHVLVGFIDGSDAQPVILRSLPHPQADRGQAAAEPRDGQALRPTRAQGDVSLHKHHGTVTGIDAAGNVVTRTLYANDGSLTPQGAPPPPPMSGELGNMVAQLHARAQRLTELLNMDAPQSPQVVLREVLSQTLLHTEFLRASAHLLIEDAKGRTLEAENGGADATLKVGSATHSAAVAEYLMALYASLKATLDTHVHASALGPTSTMQAGGFTAPAWDDRIGSTHLRIPEEA